MYEQEATVKSKIASVFIMPFIFLILVVISAILRYSKLLNSNTSTLLGEILLWITVFGFGISVHAFIKLMSKKT